MPYTFAVAIPYTAITIAFIVLARVVGAFVRRRSRDRCLTDFAQNMVTLEQTDGKIVWGKLRVENTGLELSYPDSHKDEDGHYETSYILYKYEYPNIGVLIRFHDELSERKKKRREKDLKKTYRPTSLRRLKRRILNVFRAVRDSVLEVIDILVSQARRSTPAGKMLTSQDKYVSQMKQELMGTVGTSYEPLLERHIGKKVVLDLVKGEKILEYCGVLKDYTADFVEIMDVDYQKKEDEPVRKADLVVLRQYGVVRHLGE